MTQDPWSRPTIDDLRRVLESIGKPNTSNNRANERLELSVPAEIKTPRGNTISSMTREISRTGIGLLHRGAVSPGEVVVRMAAKHVSSSITFRLNGVLRATTGCS